MRKLFVLCLAAVLLTPLGARASATCTLVTDAEGDPQGNASVLPHDSSTGADIDILDVTMTTTSDGVQVGIHVRNLEAIPSAPANLVAYTGGWMIGDRVVFATAKHSRSGWSFEGVTDTGPDTFLIPFDPVGTIDYAASTVLLLVPSDYVGGATLERVLASAHEVFEESQLGLGTGTISLLDDQAPDSAPGPTYAVGSHC